MATSLTADEALQKLMDGNRRHASGSAMHPNQSSARRQEALHGQRPFAAVLGCADSRVSPEILFDQGIGDLFAVRVAGNVADDFVLGSLEYAVEHLGVPLIVVLGHQSCGAVTAALQEGSAASGHIARLVMAIRPAVDQVRWQPGDLLANAIDANTKRAAYQVASSAPVLSGAVQAGRLKVVAARYDIDSGLVTLLA